MTANPGFGSRVGGVLCLDFVNTVRGRVANPGARGRDYGDLIVDERLTSCAALLRWGAFAEILTAREARQLITEAERRPARAANVLRRAIAVREAIYRLCVGAIVEWPPRLDDLTTLNRELGVSHAHQRLIAGPRSLVRAAPELPAALDGVLWAVAASAEELLTGPRLDRVGKCPGDVCGWLFLDTSRAGRRQWCDMRDCGNVAKVRRFRDKAHPD